MRKHRARSGRFTRWAAVAASWALPVMALAQDDAPLQPSLSRTPAPWLGYVLMIVLLALVLGVSLMPSKRGHQD